MFPLLLLSTGSPGQIWLRRVSPPHGWPSPHLHRVCGLCPVCPRLGLHVPLPPVAPCPHALCRLISFHEYSAFSVTTCCITVNRSCKKTNWLTPFSVTTCIIVIRWGKITNWLTQFSATTCCITVIRWCKITNWLTLFSATTCCISYSLG